LSVNDLYSEIILEHYKEPHNVGELDCPEIHSKGFNESCGDDIRIYAKVRDGKVEEIKFVGKGCAISQSSASMMTDMLNGKTIDEVKAFVHQFTKSITGSDEFPTSDEWFELSALKGVIKFPIRVKCASLAWHTLLQGINQYEKQNNK
jgi:nitrogen fixation protein NifU and related proteins